MQRSKSGRDYVRGKKCSPDLKKKVIEDLLNNYEGNVKTAYVKRGAFVAVAKSFLLKHSSVSNIWREHCFGRSPRCLNNGRGAGRPRKLTAYDIDFIKHTKALTPSITSKEILSELKSVSTTEVKPRTIRRVVGMYLKEPETMKKICLDEKDANTECYNHEDHYNEDNKEKSKENINDRLEHNDPEDKTHTETVKQYKLTVLSNEETDSEIEQKGQTSHERKFILLEQNEDFKITTYEDLEYEYESDHSHSEPEPVLNDDNFNTEQTRETLVYIQQTQDTFVRLNIGGQLFDTSHYTLGKSPYSVLAKLGSSETPVRKINDTIFIDRSGKHFEFILNFLRNDCQMPETLLPNNPATTKEILMEAKFYNILELVQLLQPVSIKQEIC